MRTTMHPVSGYAARPVSGHCLVVTTCADEVRAEALARGIVEGRLAACVQLFPVASVYRWQAAIESAREVALHAKTDAARLGALVAYLEAEHDYEVPEILVTRLAGGSEAYLDWVDASVR